MPMVENKKGVCTVMTRWFNESKLGAVVAAGILGAGMVAGGLAGVGATAASAATSATLTMESSPASSITQSFNPFDATSTSAVLGVTSLIYEPLIQFDPAKASVVYPWLATRWTWSNRGRSITFTIRKGVRFSDGSLLTPADVAFTYDLIKGNPSANTFGVNPTSVTSSGDTVTLSFTTPQYTALQTIASVYIVPKAIWSSISDPATYTDPNPVGTGPYELGSFSSQGITLKKNPDYWQPGLPKISTVIFPAYTSNTAAENALVTNQADWEGNFISGLGKIFTSKSPHHKTWFAPVNTNSLFPNLDAFPTNQLAVRQAISLAINRTEVGAVGESGLEPPARNASGLTLPTYSAYLSPAIAKLSLNDTPSIAAAKAVLEKAGWKMGSSGYFAKGGKELSLTIKDPSSYSDYALDDTLMAQQLRKAGIDATFDGETVPGWTNDLNTGNFQLTQHWSLTAVNPFEPYNNWLNSALTAPIGKPAQGDWERLRSAAIDRDLARLAAAPTVAAGKAALAPIAKFVASDLPIIPTVYGAAFMEYNDTSIVGWPSPQNPYESGSPNAPTNEVVVLHLRPRS